MPTKVSQIPLKAALARIFASAARVAVFRLFLLDPARSYYVRQIEQATGLAIRAVQRELERLASISLLHRRTEGNRIYYQVDIQFPFFPELHSMFLKTFEPHECLRAIAALDTAVGHAFLCEAQHRVLLVLAGTRQPGFTFPAPYKLAVMTREDFTRALSENPKTVEPFLARGVDLLGRREDMIWRRIEAAGYNVPKGKGVP